MHTFLVWVQRVGAIAVIFFMLFLLGMILREHRVSLLAKWRGLLRTLWRWGHKGVLNLVAHTWEQPSRRFDGCQRVCVDCGITQTFDMESLTWS